MALELDDPRWAELAGSYGGVSDVISWLSEIYESRSYSGERLGDLINEVCHQGDTSTAMYAVSGHLIRLAADAESADALVLLSHAGYMHAMSKGARAVACPPFLAAAFEAEAREGARLLAPLLPLATDFDSFNHAVSGLAGFIGQHAFARFLFGLDYFQGEFSHVSLEEPFPNEAYQ